MKTETIISEAEIVATFFRALINNGVPMLAATNLASTYIISIRSAAANNERPREPWEEPPL